MRSCFIQGKEKNNYGKYAVSAALLAKKENGVIRQLDAFDTGMETADDTAYGGMVGGLLGIIGGPLGMLLGGALDAAIDRSGADILKLDAVEVAEEIRQARELQKQMEKEAKKLLLLAMGPVQGNALQPFLDPGLPGLSFHKGEPIDPRGDLIGHQNDAALRRMGSGAGDRPHMALDGGGYGIVQIREDRFGAPDGLLRMLSPGGQTAFVERFPPGHTEIVA